MSPDGWPVSYSGVLSVLSVLGCKWLFYDGFASVYDASFLSGVEAYGRVGVFADIVHERSYFVPFLVVYMYWCVSHSIHSCQDLTDDLCDHGPP